VAGVRKIYLQTLDNRSDEAVFQELYGLGQDFDERYLEALAAVTPEDVRRVANAYLDPDKLVLAVVGDERSVEEAKAVLAK
jgi:predicted Zn-dependent peptidase